jgi:hypothetical protein
MMAAIVVLGLVDGWRAWVSWVFAAAVGVLIFYVVAGCLLWFSRSVRLFFHELPPWMTNQPLPLTAAA